ncbi:MAG: YbaB/EbfC family nucleoid-associated protein [Pseudomonadales bacterium]|nr:YbaB/EbfC family nucleoid-associated protein [Pseudomonadales bacterium]
MGLDNRIGKLLGAVSGLQDLVVGGRLAGRVKEALGSLETTGEAGAGLVKISINASYEVLNVEIADIVFEESNKEVVEQLVASAMTDASRRMAESINRVTSSAMEELVAGIAEGKGDS